MLIEDLVGALGAQRVDVREEARWVFARDLTEADPSPPEVVVRADSVAQIQNVLRLAHKYKVPITPVIADLNVSGLAIPERAGIILDLTGMNRILEVNAADLYMVIEPGVTWEQVRRELDEHHPSVRFGYPTAPPNSSVLANALLDGQTNLSLRFGTTGQWINGIEAVLAHGEIILTGSAAFGAPWCAGSPLPNLTGLFVNAHGTTGIVTQMSIQLWPARKHRKRYLVPAFDGSGLCDFLAKLAREDLCDDLGAFSWPLPKMALGISPHASPDPNEPTFYCVIDFSSSSRDGLADKDRLIRRILKNNGDAGGFSGVIDVERAAQALPQIGNFLDLPMRANFLLDHPGGGLSFIGAYGPVSRWAQAVSAGMNAMVDHGYPPVLLLRPMWLAHYTLVHHVVLFDRNSREERHRVRSLNEELCEGLLRLGFVPYKTPPWVLRKFETRLDPGFLQLQRRIKAVLDPDGLLNPGKWLT